MVTTNYNCFFYLWQRQLLRGIHFPINFFCRRHWMRYYNRLQKNWRNILWKSQSRHVKALKTFVHQNFNNDKLLSRVFVHEGNVMTLMTLKRLSKNMEDSIPISIKEKIYVRVASSTLGVLIANVMVRSKEVRLEFFVIDGKSCYYVILNQYWFHTCEWASSSSDHLYTILYLMSIKDHLR